MKRRVGILVVVLLVLAFTTSSYAYKMNSNGGGNSWKKNTIFEDDSFKSLLDDCNLFKITKNGKAWKYKDKDKDMTYWAGDWFDGFKFVQEIEEFQCKNGTGAGGNSAVPIPATFWLFGSGLAGLLGLSRKLKK